MVTRFSDSRHVSGVDPFFSFSVLFFPSQRFLFFFLLLLSRLFLPSLFSLKPTIVEGL